MKRTFGCVLARRRGEPARVQIRREGIGLRPWICGAAVWSRGEGIDIAFRRVRRTRDGWEASGTVRTGGGTWTVTDVLVPRGNTLVVDREWRYRGRREPSVRLGISVRVPVAKPEHWTIPYISMDGNPGSRSVPRGMVCGGKPWWFREERTSAPGLMTVEAGGVVAGLYTEPGRSDETISACCLEPGDGCHTLRIIHPHKEVPLTFLGRGGWAVGGTGEQGLYAAGGSAPGLIVENGARFSRRFHVVLDRAAAPRHGYARAWESAWRNLRDPLAARVPLRKTEKLLWKSLDEHFWFEKGRVRGYGLRIDRNGDLLKAMAPVLGAGWCAPTGLLAWLALRRAIRERRPGLAHRAVQGVDFFVRHAPRRDGTFLTHFNLREMKWDAKEINAVQMGDLAFWMLKCVGLARGAGRFGRLIDAGRWTRFALSFCDLAVRTQRRDGAFGAHWTPDGKLIGFERAMGIHAARAVLEAHLVTGNRGYLAAAERGARFCIRTMIDREAGYGDCTDILDNTTENDAAGVTDLLIDLYRATGKRLYLDKAVRAAEFCLSFMFAYNVYFPPETECGRRGMRTRGLPAISPETAFVCWFFAPQANAFLELWKETGERRWREYAVALIRSSLQMMTERGDTFGVAPHLVGCRAEVIPVLDTIKDRRIWKKGMTGYAWDPPVAWPAAFNLLNFAFVEDRFPGLAGLWAERESARGPGGKR